MSADPTPVEVMPVGAISVEVTTIGMKVMEYMEAVVVSPVIGTLCLSIVPLTVHPTATVIVTLTVQDIKLVTIKRRENSSFFLFNS